MLDSQHGNWSSALKRKRLIIFCCVSFVAAACAHVYQLYLELRLLGRAAELGILTSPFLPGYRFPLSLRSLLAPSACYLKTGSNRRGRRPRGCPTELRALVRFQSSYAARDRRPEFLSTAFRVRASAHALANQARIGGIS